MTSRILVVDDIAANARLLEIVLQDEYFVTKIGLSGFDAVETASAWQPDLVLLDVMMPELDGYEVCRRLKAKAETAHIPIVMVTALEEAVERIRGLECGADDFFTKPVEHEVLLARVKGLLRLKHLFEEWNARRELARSLGLTQNALQEPLVTSRSVLVVDDHEASARRLQEILAQDDVVVSRAGTAEAAAEAIERDTPDLLIINLGLREEDPLRIIAHLRAAKLARDIPLLLIAEADQRQLCVRGLQLGADDCVQFPLNDMELRLRVRNQLRLKLYRDQLRADVWNALRLGAVDDLTGLHNKRFFRHRLAEIMKKDQGALSILMIDIDKFKSINDGYGHQAGDRVLQAVAHHLQSSVRASDLAARYGGEEFAVIMPDADERDAGLVAERIRSTIEKALYVVSVDQSLQVTVSIGATVAPTGSSDADALIKRADQALYDAKNSGRNKVIFG